MKKELNISEILKDKPQGVKLYSSICGAVELKEVLDVRKKKSIVVKELNSSNQHRFWYDGKFFKAGQCVLQPSENMADWSKFAWKKGDVLVTEDGSVHIIFENFENDAYTMFSGKYYYSKDGKKAYSYFKECDNVITEEFTLETDDVAQTYIKTIEEHLDGKLNLETLEIEKQLEFKDGDIVVYGKSVAICRKIYKHTLSFYVSLDEMFGLLFADEVESSEEYRFATEEEKQQLFDALEKEGKAWDAEKKQIVDLKPKVELKPFDKVLVKDNPYGSWEPALFWKKVDVIDLHPYMVIGGKRYRFCEPYEGNEHFLND